MSQNGVNIWLNKGQPPSYTSAVGQSLEMFADVKREIYDFWGKSKFRKQFSIPV